MAEAPLTTPVVLTLFNRPEWTATTFARIAAAKPTQLFLIADGPRPNHPTDAENCAAARAVVERVDWACEVRRNFSDENMGPRRRLSSGIDWVFAQVEAAMILEHDVLVEPTFFRFAQEMLERYADDGRIMHVTGYNPVLPMHQPTNYPYSYYFSQHGANWGWATWRRAWQRYYDVDMKLWTPELQIELAKHPALNQTIVNAFARTHGGLNTWDYQWIFARVMQSGLSIVPVKNLARNIGIGPQATNTTNSFTRHAAMTTTPQEFPLLHPPSVLFWPSYERAALRAHYGLHWRNQLVRRSPKWLVYLAMKMMRWLERQRSPRSAQG